MEINQQEKIKECLEIIKGFTPPQLAELNKAIEAEFNIQGGTFAPTSTQKVEEQKTASSTNVSLKITEVGKQPIPVYTAVKDIVNANGGQQINIINAKQLIDQKKPILENIPKAKAEEYKKQLEEKGAKVELDLFQSLPQKHLAQEQRESYEYFLNRALPKLLQFYFPVQLKDYNNQLRLEILNSR
ncbi:2851_t:CDS:2 [Entrophospora sp. SA101]|nr:2851_t:CDS:2 [Entrophospora sp. SA101]CAJ0898099.1 4688_t:CDS:2 [Entrophospora sp. SA101]CAJ0919106.1 485_t:CDS:2 [Entrophospora sp. SA101]